MILPLLTLALIASSPDDAVNLNRVNKPGEIQKYKVFSHLNIEQKQLGMDYFLPEKFDMNYDFSLDVKKEKADGIVEAIYKRPTMTQIEGETGESEAKTKVEKVDIQLKVDLSPINKLLNIVDLSPKKDDPKKKDGLWMGSRPAGISPVQGDFLGSFIGELQRLALFVGSIDSSMDFQPKLPLFEVTKGETWKETVSYSPQKLKSKSGKTVMQRLDYVYTYEGVVESKGIKVHRISATLDMNADMAQFMKDNMGAAEFSASGLKEISFALKAKIDYDLDLQTRRTLRAEGNSEGGFKIVVTQYPDEPVVEQKLKGKTTMTLQK